MTTLGKRLAEIADKSKPLHLRPNMRTVFYREHWGERREFVPEARHTYRAVLHGQQVEVRVLPSAKEATPQEWEQFKMIPKFPGPYKHRGGTPKLPTLTVPGYEHYERMDETAFEAMLLKARPGEET